MLGVQADHAMAGAQGQTQARQHTPLLCLKTPRLSSFWYEDRDMRLLFLAFGSRGDVQHILPLSHLAAGMTHEEIIKDFPPLTETAILACLAYVAEHGISVQS